MDTEQPENTEDPKNIVRRGYDAVSSLYDEAYGADTKERAVWARKRCRRPSSSTETTALSFDPAWTGTEPNWLGGGAPMWWSHADAATSRTWIREAGLTVEREEFLPEGDSGHALFWARRPAGQD